MSLKRTPIATILVVILIVAGNARVTPPQQNQYMGFVLNSPVGEPTAVRFFYDPAVSDYFHFPVVFRAANSSDLRLITPPRSVEGRTAYISFAEMQQLMQALSHAKLSWQESEQIEVLGRAFQIPRSDLMDVLVVSSKGTAKAKVRPSRICETFKPLESTFKTKLALWEFQRFGSQYGCQFPGFNFDAYPDRN